MKPTTLSQADELVEKYFVFCERRVRAGTMSPLSGVERLLLEMFTDWLCERYSITYRQMRK